MKAKVGDKVKITEHFYGHHFQIGDEVVITKTREYDEDYDAKQGEQVWAIRDDEFELVEK